MKKDYKMAKLIKVSKKSEVKKADVIVKARYKLSPLAIKFVSVIISNLKRGDDINEEYIFKVKDFQELTGQKTKRIYNLIEEAVNNLLTNPLTIPLDDEKKSILKANWISGAIYNDGEIRFMIYPKLRPYLLEVKEKFLRYKLENILPLKSSYSIRIYEILKDWYEMNKRYGNKTEKIIKLEEFKDILEIPKSYIYGMIKKRILLKAKSELEEYTDIMFDFEEIKTGRKVTHIKLIIKDNPNKIESVDFQKPYLKSFKTFTDYLRKKYAGNQKTFFSGIDTKTGKTTFFGINNDYLLYGFVPGEMETTKYNSLESMQKYEKFYQVVKNSELFQDLIEGEIDFYEVFKENRELFNIMQQEVKEILES
jgi:plasmid replication initiation protein